MCNGENSIQIRLKTIIDELKKRHIIHNQSEFAEVLNKHASYISECLSGKRLISEKLIHEVKDKFPLINYEWIMEGTGKPILDYLDFTQNIFGDDNNNNNNTTINFAECSTSEQYIQTLLHTINHLTQQNNQAQDALKTTQELLKRSQEQIDRLLEILSKKHP